MANPKTPTCSVPEAARTTGFSLKYIYDLVHSGKLTAEKIDGKWRIAADALEARRRKPVQQ